MPCPRQAHGGCLARFTTQGNGLEPTELNQLIKTPCHQNAMIRQGGFASADQLCSPGAPGSYRRSLGPSRLGGGRNFRDGLQDLGSDLVGVALGVRATVFQITLVVVLDERVRHADRSTAVGNAVAELVPGGGLVLAG